MKTKNKTISEIIQEAKELTQENAHTEARILLAELAGHKNAKLLKNVLELQTERGDLSDSLANLRYALFLPVYQKLSVCFPEYMKDIHAAL
jgi:hypothetical protein